MSISSSIHPQIFPTVIDRSDDSLETFFADAIAENFKIRYTEVVRTLFELRTYSFSALQDSEDTTVKRMINAFHEIEILKDGDFQKGLRECIGKEQIIQCFHRFIQYLSWFISVPLKHPVTKKVLPGIARLFPQYQLKHDLRVPIEQTLYKKNKDVYVMTQVYKLIMRLRQVEMFTLAPVDSKRFSIVLFQEIQPSIKNELISLLFEFLRAMQGSTSKISHLNIYPKNPYCLVPFNGEKFAKTICKYAVRAGVRKFSRLNGLPLQVKGLTLAQANLEDFSTGSLKELKASISCMKLTVNNELQKLDIEQDENYSYPEMSLTFDPKNIIYSLNRHPAKRPSLSSIKISAEDPSDPLEWKGANIVESKKRIPFDDATKMEIRPTKNIDLSSVKVGKSAMAFIRFFIKNAGAAFSLDLCSVSGLGPICFPEVRSCNIKLEDITIETGDPKVEIDVTKVERLRLSISKDSYENIRFKLDPNTPPIIEFMKTDLDTDKIKHMLPTNTPFNVLSKD